MTSEQIGDSLSVVVVGLARVPELLGFLAKSTTGALGISGEIQYGRVVVRPALKSGRCDRLVRIHQCSGDQFPAHGIGCGHFDWLDRIVKRDDLPQFVVTG